jgi:hypothetical protein
LPPAPFDCLVSHVTAAARALFATSTPPAAAHLAEARHHVWGGDALVKLQAAAARLQDAGNQVVIPHHLGT